MIVALNHRKISGDYRFARGSVVVRACALEIVPYLVAPNQKKGGECHVGRKLRREETREERYFFDSLQSNLNFK